MLPLVLLSFFISISTVWNVNSLQHILMSLNIFLCKVKVFTAVQNHYPRLLPAGNAICNSCHFQLLRLSRWQVIDPVNIFYAWRRVKSAKNNDNGQPVVVCLCLQSSCCIVMICARVARLLLHVLTWSYIAERDFSFCFTSLLLTHGNLRSKSSNIKCENVCASRPDKHMGGMNHGTKSGVVGSDEQSMSVLAVNLWSH